MHRLDREVIYKAKTSSVENGIMLNIEVNEKNDGVSASCLINYASHPEPTYQHLIVASDVKCT